MLIGVISDTHAQIDYTRRALRLFKPFELELVLHCGDLGSADIVPLFQRWPTHFVFGNVDHPRQELRAAISQARQTFYEPYGSLQVAGLDIAFIHGDDVRLLGDLITSGKWQLVCHGHTHVARQHREGPTLVVNPGAVYRANPHRVAIVQLPELVVTSLPV